MTFNNPLTHASHKTIRVSILRVLNYVLKNLSFSSTKNTKKTYNIRRTLAGNKLVDHSDVVGASPVGVAPTTSSLST